MPIPLYAAHSLAYAQCLKNCNIYDPFKFIDTHFMFVVYNFDVVVLFWFVVEEPTRVGIVFGMV